MIIVTGGAGFIGSATVWRLNELGNNDIIIVDELRSEEKWKNLNGLKFADFINKYDFIDLVKDDALNFEIEAIIHLGACSATNEKDADYLMENNVKFSQELAIYCYKKDIRFIYASSAATYGAGEYGYSDNESELEKLRPLNMYGYSKHLFDIWLKKNGLLDLFVGLKYFNVYGPNEYHKNDMRSVVHKAFEQIYSTGKVNLFKSYHPDYKDGEQKRDFLYVKDAVEMTLFFLENKDASGIYNIGTGNSRTWTELVSIIFDSLHLPINIEFIDMPENLKNKYQYYTKADNKKILELGYNKKISSIEDGVKDYVQNYLLKKLYLGY